MGSSYGAVVSGPWLQRGCGISSSSVDARVFFIVVGLWMPLRVGRYMVNVVRVCVAPKVQIVYVHGVECLVMWVSLAPAG